MRFIGVDLGTTSIKGAVLDLDAGALADAVRRPFPDPISGLPRLHYEVNPDAVLRAAREVLDELLSHAPDAKGILLCSQMHGVVLTDGGLKPCTNLITWQDQRALVPGPGGASAFDDLRATLSAGELRALGNDLWASRPLSVLHWLQLQGALPDGAAYLSLPDFVAASLTGTPPATDLTHAAATSALDLERQGWAEEMLARLGLGGIRLPRIAGRAEQIGEYAWASRSIPWYPPVSDQQCSLLGAGLEGGELSVNVSTGSQVGLLSERAMYGPYQTRPFFDGAHLLTNIHIPAGRSLNALMRLLTELAAAEGAKLERMWANVERLAEAAGDTDLGVDLSFFAGATGARGSISNAREDNLTVGHLFRAAYMSMAENYERFALRISPERAWQRLVFSGGLVLQSGLLRRMIIERFACPYRLAEGGDDSLVGLLAVALHIAGRAPGVLSARRLIGRAG